MQNNTTTRRLGDFIRQVDVRNKDLAVTNLKGLSNEKVFIESIANTIGTDFSGYKIVRPCQFAYVPVTSRNGDKITIALYGETNDCIVSQAYTVFDVIYDSILLPEYLMMWFCRPEFDRYARFKSNGSAREVFDWDEMCEVELPVPPIEEQRAIVARHKAIEHKIDVNRRLIAALEETARTIYRHTFVDNIDPENLPEGWSLKSVNELSNSYRGVSYKSSDELQLTEDIKNFGVMVVRGNNIKNSHFVYDENRVFIPSNLTDSDNYIQKWDIIMTMSSGSPAHIGKCFMSYYDMPYVYGAFLNKFKPLDGLQYLLYLYLTSWQFSQDVKRNANGTGIDNLTLKVFDEIYLPYHESTLMKFNHQVEILFAAIALYQTQTERLEHELLKLLKAAL